VIYTDFTQPVPQGSYVATIGFFDGVHRGHRFLLEKVMEVARARGLRTMAVTFPEHPAQVLHPGASLKQLTSFTEKAELLSAAGIDVVVGLNFTPGLAEMSAQRFMDEVLARQLHVKTLLTGWDHKFGHNRSEGFNDYVRYGRQLGIEVLQQEAWQMNGIQVSSSVVRQLLADGSLDEANRCLGYAYLLQGEVVAGRQVGRTLGFPTANLRVEPTKMVPANGVYAVRVECPEHPEERYFGMLNIGHRPTLDNGADCTIEVHIFDFDGNLYGKTLRLHLDKKIRHERMFDSLDTLREQLTHDKETIQQCYTNKE
jgi:riboflavin kinase/FMN adenylyltransferase